MPNITTNHAINYTNLFAVIHGLQILSNEINKRAKYKTNIRARENQMKKTHVLQLTLKNIHAMA